MSERRVKLEKAKTQLERIKDQPYTLDGLLKAAPSILLMLQAIIEILDDLSEL